MWTFYRKKGVQLVAALFVYLGIDYLYFCYGRDFSFFTSVFVPSADPLQFIWFLNWWPFALLHGINPFVTYYVWHPTGFNLTWATSVPSLALLAAPVTLYAGATATFNILALLSPPLSAFTAYILVRYLTDNFPASLMAGYIFGFSSYVLGQMPSHLQCNFVCLIPLAVFIALKRYQGDFRRSLFIAYLTLLIVLQCGISLEILASTTFFGSAAIIFCYFTHNANRTSLIALTKDMILSYIAAAIILTPFLYYIVVGYKSIPIFFHDVGELSADLLNFIIPTSLTGLGGSLFQNISFRFTSNAAEEGAYLGVILVLITTFSIFENMKERWGKPLLFVTVFVFVSSLGPYLHINGVTTRIPLIWKLFTHVPVLKHALPIRFTMFVAFTASIWIAYWLSNNRITRNYKLIRYALVIAGIVFIAPNMKAYSWDKVDTPPFLKTDDFQISEQRRYYCCIALLRAWRFYLMAVQIRACIFVWPGVMSGLFRTISQNGLLSASSTRKMKISPLIFHILVMNSLHFYRHIM